MRKREEILWELMDYFSAALEDLLVGDKASSEDFIKEFSKLSKDLEPKVAEALKRGLFLILKSRDLGG